MHAADLLVGPKSVDGAGHNRTELVMGMGNWRMRSFIPPFIHSFLAGWGVGLIMISTDPTRQRLPTFTTLHSGRTKETTRRTCRMQVLLFGSVAFWEVVVAAAWQTTTTTTRSRHAFACRRHARQRSETSSLLSAAPIGRVEDTDDWVRLSSESLERLTGTNLYERMDGVATSAPAQVHVNERYGVLSHGAQEDPIYCYFNAGALLTFQYPEDEIYQLPSRYSAPNGAIREARDEQIKKNVEETQVQVYPAAIRQSKGGDQFQLVNVTLWNVYDDGGTRIGQTALFDRTKIVPVTAIP